MFTEIETRLKAPFPGDRISWRVGATKGDKSAGMALAYIDARDVMDRLDEVVGPENWQSRYPHANGKTVCEIDIYIEGRGWVTKSDGAGDTDHEAEKGALSDAFKRAAVRWGIGRYLYDLHSPWVEIEPSGPKSYKIKASELPKLKRLAAGAAAPVVSNRDEGHDPGAKDMAVALLNSCKSLDELKDCWVKNAKGWQELLAARDFTAVERAKEAVKALLSVTGPKAEADPFSEAA